MTVATTPTPGRPEVLEAWRPYNIEPPAPSILAACRRLADDEMIVRLVNRLGWEGRLRQYTGAPLVELVRIYAEATNARGAA